MNNNEYRVGVNRGLPVGMGYFSVSFGFGAMAVSQGVKTLDAVLISATNLTSAGQFAGLTLIVAAATPSVRLLARPKGSCTRWPGCRVIPSGIL